MRRDRDRDHRDSSDDFDNSREPSSSNRSDPDETNSAAEMQLRALWMLDEVIRMTPRNDPRLGVLLALREQLETDEAVLDDGRLRVAMDSQGMQSRVVYRGEALQEEPLKAGSEVRMEPNFKVALEHFAAKETMDYYLEEVPILPWSKIGGQEEAIGVIK